MWHKEWGQVSGRQRPSVYLRVDMVEPGGSNRVGRVLDLYTKGWLPYTLRWQVRVIENRHPFGYTMQANGTPENCGAAQTR